MNFKIRIIALNFLILLTNTQMMCTSPAQNIGTQFMAATISNVGDFYRAQPNCNGAVGPKQYIQITNQNIRSFNKKTGQPDGILNSDSATFFGVPAADTMLTFDRWGQRWIMISDFDTLSLGCCFTGFSPLYGVVIAYSDGPVITEDTQWTTQVITLDAMGIPYGFPDSPKLSSDQNAVYINADAFTNSFAFAGVAATVIPQSSFITGNVFNYTTFPFLFNPTEYPDTGGLEFAPSPDNYDPNPEFGYIIVAPTIEAPGILTYNNYFMLRIINPASSNPTLYPSSANPISLAAPVYTDAVQVPHQGNLYGDNALLQNFTGLDFGMPHIRNKQLYFTICGLVNAAGVGTLPQDGGDRTAILWYQYDLTGDVTGQGRGIETESTIPVLIQSGVIFDPTITATPLNYWNPALMTDKNGNMAIIGNLAGENSYIQAFYTGRKASDPLGTTRTPTLLTNNNAPYLFGTLNTTDPNGLRWGDYCSLKPDPCHESKMWATSQVVAFQDGWGILATQLIPA